MDPVLFIAAFNSHKIINMLIQTMNKGMKKGRKISHDFVHM